MSHYQECAIFRDFINHIDGSSEDGKDLLVQSWDHTHLYHLKYCPFCGERLI